MKKRSVNQRKEHAKYKVVLLDFDGTLFDTSEGIINCIQYAQNKMGLPIYEKNEEYRKFIGPPLIYSFTHFCNLSQEDGEKACSYYRERYNETGLFESRVYPGMERLLQDLRDSGVKVGIASAKPEHFIYKILDHFGIRDYFDVVAGSGPDGSISDKDILIQMAYDQLRTDDTPLQEAGIVMIGDRTYDAIGARKQQIDFIGALYGFGMPEEFLAEGYSAMAEDVDGLRKYLFDEPHNKENEV